MPRKKKEEIQETTAENAAEETKAEAQETKSAGKSKHDKGAKAEGQEAAETSIIDTAVETVTAAVETVANTASDVVSAVGKTVGLGGSEEETVGNRGNRAEKVGVVWSDKMQKTVVVRVDRLVKHPMYRKYVRRKKKFMAHDELGASVGDKVRIVETRPLSAKKRWRVVEIIQKAEK